VTFLSFNGIHAYCSCHNAASRHLYVPIYTVKKETDKLGKW
jgi:hypothetical protein